ncbi:MAG: DNA cytosine methyltransferase [Deltaproteobacteria bacterium]|jgi:DNA (cytosine-5)-methyltransferase 1|nr:DNA cytosine methyltransferase [Deltaproteobacteria bacterium]
MKNITLGSLFDGIAGFPLAASRHGIEAVWASEIDPSCVSIARRHFPGMAHLGDITRVSGAKIEPVDIISFGSPCQDLSVAGRRAGLAGERSGLFAEAVRIICEMRAATNGRHPTWAVWENVPGALSSNHGMDFRTVLGSLVGAEVPMPGSGRWARAGMVRGDGADCAWRVLDAQFWGVPQRRKRVFLVADFGGARAAKILFVDRSLRGDTAARGAARKEAAAGVGGGAAGADSLLAVRGMSRFGGRNPQRADKNAAAFAANQRDEVRDLGGVAGALQAQPGMKQQTFVVDARGNGGGEISPTVTGDHQSRVTDYTALLVDGQDDANCLMPWDRQNWRAFGADGNDGGGGRNPGEVVMAEAQAYPTNTQAATKHKTLGDHTGFSIGKEGDPAYTLQEAHSHGVAVIYPEDTVDPLLARADGSPCVDRGQPFVVTAAGFMAGQGAKAGGVAYQEDVSPALKSASSGTNTVPSVIVAKTVNTMADGSNVGGDVAYTLDGSPNQAVLVAAMQGYGDYEEADVCSSLKASGGDYGGGSENIVVGLSMQGYGEYKESEASGALRAAHDTATETLVMADADRWTQTVRISRTVRRLMPVETERLQGFPDGWTAFGSDGGPISDTQRYKAVGNSVALPCLEHIMAGIAEAERRRREKRQRGRRRGSGEV